LARTVILSESTQLAGSNSTFNGFAGSFNSNVAAGPEARTVVRAT
jgi:hypothetical protein